MLEIFSHTLGFAVLFVAAVFDLRTTEVPDAVAIVGLVGGVVLHGLTAYSVGSLEPLVWSLGVGSVFMVFGWGMYYLGIWGGADAFAIGVLGFTAPYSLSGPGVLHPINLFVNVMLVGFGYTLLAASYSALRSSHVLRETYIRIVRDEKKVSAGVLSAAAISALVHTYLGLNGYVYFTLLTGMIFLYYFLKVIENREMKREVEVSELEGGEVIATDLEVEIGEVREENMVGRFPPILMS